MQLVEKGARVQICNEKKGGCQWKIKAKRKGYPKQALSAWLLKKQYFCPLVLAGVEQFQFTYWSSICTIRPIRKELFGV